MVFIKKLGVERALAAGKVQSPESVWRRMCKEGLGV